uniref:Uncharacterized protein LOC104232343 n=1 Tax=Nicotiana sylvestris TaxID=4096 RepID=A0A1U7XBJ1_NICSY|nr:PREDICTED: uncharacterized protein LOC104232343 [Nicotiana sylvestris]
MANQVIIGALFPEGTSQVRPPYFNGQHFSHWKVHMEIYTKAYDVKVWRVIKKGNYPLPAAAQPLVDPEDIDSYTDEQMAVVQVNNKVRNFLYNAISGEDYEKIFNYDTAKEMWNKLEVTYERTSKVKETYINMLVHDYELFQMKEGEYIEEMFARFSKIISDLKAFGKPYSSSDQVRKILRNLPTTWQTKVVTLESQDMNKLSYDELRGELIAFEKTHLKKTKQEEKKKIVAFKATTEMAENDIDDDPEALQEEIATVSRNMDGLIRRFKNTRRGRMPPRRSRQYNEQDKNDGKCYKCGRFGHVQAECPNLKRKISRGFNKNKSFGSWSDKDSLEHEEITNLCFMTILENGMNKLSGCWTDEDTSDDECKDDNENCFMVRGEISEVRSYNCERCNKLHDILDITLKESQKMMNELKRLNKEVKYWKLKHEVCEIEKEVLQEEFEELQMQLNGMRKSTSHSSVRSNQATYKSTGKGPARTESTSTNTNERSKNGSGVTCHYCIKSGHRYSFCRFRKSNVSGYEVKFKKTGCAIEYETGKIILPGKRYGNVYILDGFENIDGHICLTSISDDPWLWNKKLGHASMYLIEKLSKHELVIGKFDPRSDEESTNGTSNNPPEPPKESATHIVHPNEWRSEPEYPQKFIIGDPSEGMKTKGALKKKASMALISQIEPKKIEEALKDSSWLQAMQEELDQFDKNQVWKLIPKPESVPVI